MAGLFYQLSFMETAEKNYEKMFIETETLEWQPRKHISAVFYKRFTIFMGTENTLVYESWNPGSTETTRILAHTGHKTNQQRIYQKLENDTVVD